MSKFYMLVGLPGSGKSTYAETQLSNCVIHSSDALREELWGDAANQQNPQKVFDILHRRIRTDLDAGRDVVLDATNLSRKRRINLLNNRSIRNAEKICVVIATPVAECIKRDNARKARGERAVGEDVILRMAKQFQCPGYYEGWDTIVIPATNIANPLPDKAKLMAFEQNNPHHSATLGEHMRLTAHQVEGAVLQMAAQIHDIGKFYTKDFHDAKGNPTDIAHYYGHENRGAYEWLSFCAEQGVTPASDEDYILRVAELINWHMTPYGAWKSSEKAKERDRALLGAALFNEIMTLHAADVAAH